MTNNFERVLGKGGFGTVFHGYLDESTQVAVKMLSPSSVQGHKQFQAEVKQTDLANEVVVITIIICIYQTNNDFGFFLYIGETSSESTS